MTLKKNQPRKKAKADSGLTYAKAGVSIAEGDAFAERIAKNVKGIGGFSGAFPLQTTGMKKPVLLASTDGVGTKLLLARRAGALGTIGIDLVAMVVNDLLVAGARPLFFLDYYAMGKLEADEADTIIGGIRAGCEEAGIPLLGGETAEMPGVYAEGDFDLAGFGVGIADQAKLISGSKIKHHDAIIGIASSGIHSNGYSLVRAVLKHARLRLNQRIGDAGETLGETLLRPTRIYVKPVLSLLENIRPHGMAHITGGGLPGNVVRVLPEGCRAAISAEALHTPPLFRFLQEAGEIPEDEMYDVFNMGIGYVLILPKTKAAKALDHLAAAGEQAWLIGEISEGDRGVDII